MSRGSPVRADELAAARGYPVFGTSGYHWVIDPIGAFVQWEDVVRSQPPDTGGAALDVEVLARALHKRGAVCMRPVELCPGGRHDREWAEGIAAEYAALRASEVRPDENS